MSILTRPIEELLSYLLTRLHGGLLLQQLDHRNFHANVSEGIYTLKDLQLNPQAINQNLSESVLHLFSSSISKVLISVPNLFRFLEDPLSLQLHNLVIDLCSASESGYSVMREDKAPEAEASEDIQGITMLTKSIGTFLSNIVLQASLVKVRIRIRPTDKAFLQVMIGKLSVTDAAAADGDSCHKILKIEGLRVTLMQEDSEVYDPHDFVNLIALEREISVEISLSKELLFIECVISKVCALISFDQLSQILSIFTGLKKSVRYEELKVSILMETFHALGEDIQAYSENIHKTIKIREKSIKLGLASLCICVTLEEIGPFKKTWNYHEGIYPGVPTSHLVTLVNGISAEHSKNTSLKLMKIIVNHYNYLPNPAIESSELYESAKQSFFNDFFRNKANPSSIWEADLNKTHFCSGNVLNFKRNHADFQYAQPPCYRPHKNDLKIKLLDRKIQIKLMAIDVHINNALVSCLFKLFPPSKSAPSKIDIQFEVILPYLRVQYQENLDKCFCTSQDWMLMLEIFLIKLQNVKDLEGSASKIELSMYQDDLRSSIALLTNIKMCREIKESVNTELFEERKEEIMNKYYENMQGFICLKPGVFTEPYDLTSEPVFNKQSCLPSAIEEELGVARASCITKLSINALNIRLEKSTLPRLLKVLPTIPESKELYCVGTVLELKHISIELLDREKNEKKPPAPSVFSHYSLDASVVRTVMVPNDISVGLITMNLYGLKLLSLTNCMKSKEKYSHIKVTNLDIYAKHQELAYAISEKVLDITIEKADFEEINVSLSNILVSLDVLQKYQSFISDFAVDLPSEGSSSKMSKKHIEIHDILADYCKGESRALCVFESGGLDISSIDEASKGLHLTLDSVRVYTQNCVDQPHPILSLGADRPRLEQELVAIGCSVIAVLNSFESFVTLVNPRTDLKLPNEEAPLPPAFARCMLGCRNCTPLGEAFFITNEVRTSVLLHKLLDLHVNLGSIIIHLTPDTILLLKNILDFPSFPEEKEEIFRKDSDISSDESDYFPVQNNGGLAINPNEPGKITNINLQDYLSPMRVRASKAEKQPSLASVSMSKCAVIHCHCSLPQMNRGNSVDHSLHSLEGFHGFPNLRISLAVFFVAVNIYSRTHAMERSTDLRHATSSIVLKAENIAVALSKFPKKLHYSWRVTVSVENLKVLDFIPESAVNTILNYDASFQRKEHSQVVFMEVAGVWPRPLFSNETELIVNFHLLPIKVNIDQHLIEFCLNLMNWKPEEQALMYQTGSLPTGDASRKTGEPRSSYLQRLIIDTICLNIDYIPHNLEGKHPGSNLLNLFQIQDFKLVLPRTEIKGVRSLELAITQAWYWWLEHIKDKEIYKLLARLGPLSAIKNIGSALYDLVALPYTGASGADNTKQALIALVKSLSVESLTIVETLVTGMYSVVMGFSNVVGINLPSRQFIVRPLHDAQCIVDRNRIGAQHEKYKD